MSKNCVKKQKLNTELLYITATLADILSRNLSTEDVELLAAFAVALSDNLNLLLAGNTDG